jgi:hypothetical protein
MNPNPNQNKLVKIFLIALGKVIGVASIFGISVGIIMHSRLVGGATFALAFILQFVINYFIEMLAARRNTKAEFLAAQVLKEAAERQLPYDLNCAYCNTLNRVGISFNYENTFECMSCKQPNKVYIQFTTVRLTMPLTQKENSNFIDMEADVGVEQTSINKPIIVNEK